MNRTRVIVMSAGVLALFVACTGVLAEPDVWKVPLDEKAKLFEENIRANHWIDGLYPSMVELPFDPTTQGNANIAHSVCWTANYLAGESYRYQFVKKTGSKKEAEAVRKHAEAIFDAVHRCQKVTGVRGLQARGYVFGHGDSYEEREGARSSNAWRQGAGEYGDLRWRGDPSHHNYSDSIHGLGVFYDLAAEGEYKDKCREAINDLVSYWADNDLIIQKYDRSQPGVPILGFTDGKTPNLRIIMAAAGLKVASHATGDAKFDRAYERLVEQYGFKKLEKFPERMRRRFGHDDAEHVFCHLSTLFRIEKDPELLRFYKLVADALWENHKDDAQSLFTYIYFGLFPDAPGKDEALKEALWTLQTWPTKRVYRPRMNSIRKDIKIVDQRAEEPLPMYESPWDNEYQWKGNLYTLDGWLSRITVSLAVPANDRMVMYATDTNGDIYKTVDGGKNWREISQNLPANAVKLAASRRTRMLFVAANDGFYRTTTAGRDWERMPIPAAGGVPKDIVVDTTNPNVLYAVTDTTVYRSKDFGERWLGETWEDIAAGLPPSNARKFLVATGNPTMVYAVLDGIVFSKRADGTEWTQGATIGMGEYARTYPWLVADPNDPKTVYSGMRAGYEQLGGSLVSKTNDAGMTWTNDMASLYKRYEQGGMAGLLRALVRAEFNDLAVDPRDSKTLYAAADTGVLKSTDGGETWKQMNKGLDIPLAHTVFAPAAGTKVYAGTPAGLFESADGGETWTDANLCLQFDGNTKRELGNPDFLDAYYRGRYFGFITDEQAKAEPENW